jgi:chitosanase
MEAITKTRIVSVINIFETGTPDGKYDAISIYADGKPDVVKGRKTRQITYGKSQTTEQGNLKDLIADYITNKGIFSKHFEYYFPKIGIEPLVDNAMFKEVLTDAAQKDPIMRSTQDAFFDKKYYQPALTFCEENGFIIPLSILVIYDSYIHSGKVPTTIRKMFSEKTPREKGDEKAWIKAYVEARRKWLLRLPDPLPTTVYRMDCFRAQIEANNWSLDKQIMSNGELSRDFGQNTEGVWHGYHMTDTPVLTTKALWRFLRIH